MGGRSSQLPFLSLAPSPPLPPTRLSGALTLPGNELPVPLLWGVTILLHFQRRLRSLGKPLRRLRLRPAGLEPWWEVWARGVASARPLEDAPTVPPGEGTIASTGHIHRHLWLQRSAPGRGSGDACRQGCDRARCPQPSARPHRAASSQTWGPQSCCQWCGPVSFLMSRPDVPHVLIVWGLRSRKAAPRGALPVTSHKGGPAPGGKSRGVPTGFWPNATVLYKGGSMGSYGFVFEGLLGAFYKGPKIRGSLPWSPMITWAEDGAVQLPLCCVRWVCTLCGRTRVKTKQ